MLASQPGICEPGETSYTGLVGGMRLLERDALNPHEAQNFLQDSVLLIKH